MNIFYLLIGVSLFAALIFLGAFIWAVRSGQFEDNYTPSLRILFDDDEVEDIKTTKDEKLDSKKEEETIEKEEA